MTYPRLRWVEKQDLHRTPKLVLKQIAERANSRTLECYPSQETLAADLGLSRRTVGDAMRYLEEQGFIEREKRHHRSNGNRKTDLITLQMESVQTVVRTWRTYSEFLEDKNPTRYVHRANGNGSGGPMGTGPQANGNGVPSYEQEVEQEVEAGRSTSTSTSTSSRSTPTREAAMHIAAAKVDGEWSISVSGIQEEFEDNEPFKDVLGQIIEAALDGGLPASTLTLLFQESWKKHGGDHWVVVLDNFEQRVTRVRGRKNLHLVPGLGA